MNSADKFELKGIEIFAILVNFDTVNMQTSTVGKRKSNLRRFMRCRIFDRMYTPSALSVCVSETN